MHLTCLHDRADKEEEGKELLVGHVCEQETWPGGQPFHQVIISSNFSGQFSSNKSLAKGCIVLVGIVERIIGLPSCTCFLATWLFVSVLNYHIMKISTLPFLYVVLLKSPVYMILWMYILNSFSFIFYNICVYTTYVYLLHIDPHPISNMLETLKHMSSYC